MDCVRNSLCQISPRPDEEVRIENFGYEEICEEGLIDRIQAVHDALEAYYEALDDK